MPFNIRKPFVRRQTDQPVIEEAGSHSTPQYDADGKTASHAALDDGAITSGVDQLKKFKKTHKWDYNLDYDTIVCFFFPFPLACLKRLGSNRLLYRKLPTGSRKSTTWRRKPTLSMPCSRRTRHISKYGLPSAITMRTCRPTLFV